MGVRYCSAINCSNNSNMTPKLHFFRFPKDSERCQKWIQNCRREDLKGKSSTYCYGNLLLCEKHFENMMFNNPQLKITLIRNAIPTLFDVPNPPKKETLTRSVPTRNTIQSQKVSSSKRNKNIEKMRTYIEERRRKVGRPPVYGKSKEILILRRALEAKKQAMRVLRKREEKKSKEKSSPENVLRDAAKYLSANELSVLSYQLSRRKKSSNILKSLALGLSYRSPSCYKMLSKKFKLPHPRTLHRWIANYKITEGFDSQLFHSLKVKVDSMTQEEKIMHFISRWNGTKTKRPIWFDCR